MTCSKGEENVFCRKYILHIFLSLQTIVDPQTGSTYTESKFSLMKGRPLLLNTVQVLRHNATMMYTENQGSDTVAVIGTNIGDVHKVCMFSILFSMKKTNMMKV